MKSVNLFDAAASGALSGMHIALAVGAMLVAFIALMAMVNGLLGALGGLIGYPELTLELILGWVFQPLAGARRALGRGRGSGQFHRAEARAQ